MLLTSIRLAIRGLNRNKLRTILTMLGMIIGVAAVMKLRGWIVSGARRFYGQVLGTDVAFAPMFGWRFDEGRFFSAGDVAARRAAVVLGRTTCDQIFGAGARVVGQTVTIHGRSFTVVGVTDTADPDQIEMAFVPYTALQHALGIPYLHTITIEAAQAGEASRIAAEAATLLRS